MNPIHLAVYIWMFFNDLQRDTYIEVPDIVLDFSNITDNGRILGTLILKNFNVTGFDTLVSEINNINASEDENGNNDVCVYLPVGYLQIATDYIADIGIDDEIPIYGDGRFRLNASNIDFNICTFVSFDDGYVANVEVKLLYRHNPIEFTGFWKNEEVSNIIVRFLNVFNLFFAMWSAYEPERASCVLSPFVEYLLNINMGYENNTLNFNFTCLQELVAEIDFNDNESVWNYLSIPLEKYEDEGILKTILEDNKYVVLEWIKPVVSYIRTIIDEYV